MVSLSLGDANDLRKSKSLIAYVPVSAFVSNKSRRKGIYILDKEAQDSSSKASVKAHPNTFQVSVVAFVVAASAKDGVKEMELEGGMMLHM